MGLKGVYRTGEQIYAEAYVNACYIRIHWEDAYIYVNYYSSKESRDAFEQPIHQYEYRCPTADLCNGNILSLAYSVLKKEKDFIGWSDVLEAPVVGTINDVPPTTTVQ